MHDKNPSSSLREHLRLKNISQSLSRNKFGTGFATLREKPKAEI